ncbi:MAG: hypothetical protein ACTHOD_13745 [Motilibacteraceae bacterium]|nr:hypothetical protein [Motilibacteraceae bacterium]
MGTILGLVVGAIVGALLAVGAGAFIVQSQSTTPANSPAVDQPVIPVYGTR